MLSKYSTAMRLSFSPPRGRSVAVPGRPQSSQPATAAPASTTPPTTVQSLAPENQEAGSLAGPETRVLRVARGAALLSAVIPRGVVRRTATADSRSARASAKSAIFW
jgi:hypothetical protein